MTSANGDHDDDVFDWFPGGHLARVLTASDGGDDDVVVVPAAPYELFRAVEHEPAWATTFHRVEVPKMRRGAPAFPRLLAVCDDAGDEVWARFAYVPRVRLRDLVDEDEPAGVALPMAVSVVSSLASSLAALAAPHGSVGLDSAAVAVDGGARLDWRPIVALPASARTRAGALYLNNHDTMAPELVRGTPASSAADVFALGAVLFALVAGRAPFARDTWMTTLAAIAMEPAAPPLAHAAVTPELAAVVARMLEKDPDKRPAMCDVPALLARAAPWALWTQEQCADELRAMLPAEVARLAATAPPSSSHSSP